MTARDAAAVGRTLLIDREPFEIIGVMPARFESAYVRAELWTPLEVRDGNLVLRAAYDGRETLLTTNGTPEHEWRFDIYRTMLELLGMAVPVTNWSPDGTKLAAYRVDNAGVAQAPQVHYFKRHDEVVQRYHGKAGDILERYTLHILDVHGKPEVTIDLGDTTDTYPCFAGWLPDGSEVLVFRMSRDCRRVDVLAADVETGAVRELFSETGDTFLRIHHDVYFGRKIGLWLTPDGQQILWLSERDGWQHIYAYDLQGKPLGQLTSGSWAVDAVKRIDDGNIWFTARHDQERPYDQHLCRIALAGESGADRGAAVAHLAVLCRRYGVTPPAQLTIVPLRLTKSRSSSRVNGFTTSVVVPPPPFMSYESPATVVNGNSCAWIQFLRRSSSGSMPSSTASSSMIRSMAKVASGRPAPR